MSAIEKVLDKLSELDCAPRRNGAGWMARCPAHEDRNPSLGIKAAERFCGVLLQCYAGCETGEIVAHLGLDLADLRDSTRVEQNGRHGEWTPYGESVAAYDYVDENGTLLFQVLRTADKQFPVRRRDPCSKNGWSWRLGNVRPVLYRLPDLIAAVATGKLVGIVEGERDVQSLARAGMAATCNPFGAGKWLPEYSEYLSGAHVVIIADKDDAGRRHAAKVARSLAGVAADVRVMQALAGKDVTDHLAAGHGVDELVPVEERNGHHQPVEPVADEPAADEVEPVVSSWAEQDLTSVLDGTYTPTVPVLMARTDGQALLYAGMVNPLYGEPESAKSLVAQAEAARCVMAGLDVLYVDFEADKVEVVGRLLALGADAEHIGAHLSYRHPDADPRKFADDTAEWEAMLARRYTLAVLDGVTDALGTFGMSSMDNDDVARWSRLVPRTIAARTGAAVVTIDHVTKSSEGRGRFAIGGQAKLASIDGAAYMVEVVEPCGRGKRGVVSLRVTKDRPGGVRPHCGPYRRSDRTQEAARIVFDATGADGFTRVGIEPPAAGEPDVSDGPGMYRFTAFMEKISRLLEPLGTALSANDVVRRIKGRRDRVLVALDVLVSEGFVRRWMEEGHPQAAQLHESIRPYRQSRDPGSDRFEGAAP